MKNRILLLLLISCSAIYSQSEYTPVTRAKKHSTAISIETSKQVEIFTKKINRYKRCTAILLDAGFLSKAEVSGIFLLLAEQSNIYNLYLKYPHQDSIDLSLLAKIASIETLHLNNKAEIYQDIVDLNNLEKLIRLKVNINTTKQPLSWITDLKQIPEIELISEDETDTLYSEMRITYRVNDTAYEHLSLISNLNNFNLSEKSTKDLFFSLWTEAFENTGDNSGGSNITQNPALNFNAGENTFINYKPIPSLQPLIQGELPQFEQNIVEPAEASRIICNDQQTIISIPANAFQMQDGSAVKAQVKIIYRAINSQAQILASGITMSYDTAGSQELFKSNGMFELRAFAADQELKLKAGKNIEVELPAKRDSSSFNLYSLNDNTGQWEFQSPIFPDYSNTQGYLLIKDQTRFNERYNDPGYTYLLPKGCNSGDIKLPVLTKRSAYPRYNYSINLNNPIPRIGPDKSLLKLKINYKKSDNKLEKIFFTLDFHTDKYYTTKTARFFPELKPFENFVFEYDGPLTTKEFRRLYKKDIVYSDCRIVYWKGDASAILELKTSNGYLQIPVKATRISPNNRTYFNYSFIRAYRKYQGLLKIKESKFNAFLFQKQSFKYDYDSVLYNAVLPLGVVKSDYTRYKINIQILGFVNCDQIYRIEQPMRIENAIFKCGDSILTGFSMAYVVDRKSNGTYTFSSNNIILSIKNTSGILLKNREGEIYTCKGKSLREQLDYKRVLTTPIIQVSKMPKISNSGEALSSLD